MHRSLVLVTTIALSLSASASAADDALLTTHCAKCHSGTKVKGDFDLASLGTSADRKTVEAWVASLDRVKAGEMPPAGKSQLSSEGRAGLIRYLEEQIAAYGGQAEQPYQSKPRRLNNRELANSLADVLQIEHVGTHEPLANLLGDSLKDGFDTHGDTLGISEYHLEQYVNAIRSVLNGIVVEGPRPEWQRYEVPTERLAVNRFQNRRRAERANRTSTSIEILDLQTRVTFGSIPTIPVSGRYRIKVRATGVDRNVYSTDRTGVYQHDPIQLRLHLGDHTHDYDLNDGDITELEFDGWLAKGTRIELSYPTDGLRLMGNGNFKFQFRIAHDYLKANDPETYAKVVQSIPKRAPPRTAKVASHWSHWTGHWSGPRPRIFSAVVEGPFYDSWPSQRQTALIGSNPSAVDAAKILLPIAERAWRREVTNDELAPIVKLVQDQQEVLGDVGALKEGIIAILLSPSFLLINPEQESASDLLATKLSYFLASTTPDAALRRSVAEGELDSFDQVREYVAARLSQGQASPFVEEFPYAWLQLDRINFMSPDPDAFPFYHRKSVSDDMIAEVRHFFRHAVERNVPVPELLLADYSFVNADLAKVYGLEGVRADSQLRKHTFTDGRRGGLLGMGAFLTLTADSLGTSPIHRAIYVMENFLGIHPAPPPADVEILEPDIRSARTIKEVLEAHRADKACAACHQSIDPFGYAFENFGPAGSWRDAYEPEQSTATAKSKRQQQAGIPIDASSSFLSGAGYHDIVGFRELMASDANQERFVRCFIEKLLTYANGEAPTDVVAVKRILDTAAAHEYRIVETIAAVVHSPLFRER